METVGTAIVETTVEADVDAPLMATKTVVTSTVNRAVIEPLLTEYADAALQIRHVVKELEEGVISPVNAGDIVRGIGARAAKRARKIADLIDGDES